MVQQRPIRAYSMNLTEKVVKAILGRGISKAQAVPAFRMGATYIKG